MNKYFALVLYKALNHIKTTLKLSNYDPMILLIDGHKKRIADLIKNINQEKKKVS